jgi:hypothetical protein
VDVETAANISLKRSIRRVARHPAIKNPTVFACVMPQSVLHLKGTTSIEVGDEDLQASVEVIRVNVLCPAITRFLFQSAPDEIQPTFIEVIAKLVRARHPDHDWRSIRNHAKTLFHIKIDLIKNIGKESNSLEDVDSGLIHSPDNVYTEYSDPKNDEWQLKIVPVLQLTRLSKLIKITGNPEEP